MELLPKINHKSVKYSRHYKKMINPGWVIQPGSFYTDPANLINLFISAFFLKNEWYCRFKKIIM